MKSAVPDLHQDVMKMLRATSRTFYIPISRLTSGLQETVAAAYLCMRAIDEIEDDSALSAEIKADILRKISAMLQGDFSQEDLARLFAPIQSQLPEVTLRLWDWVSYTPFSIRPAVLRATAVMAGGMADWVEKNWSISSKEDLDSYTYYVAGLVGVMLNEVWRWHDKTEADLDQAVAFGRGLQAVNIIRNRVEDASRGVNFFPDGWEMREMFTYARSNLKLALQYITRLEDDSIIEFCKIPLVLAFATLEAIESGKKKLSRAQVFKLVNRPTLHSYV